MDREDIIRMAREAGAAMIHGGEHALMGDFALETFFKKAYAAGAAAEREKVAAWMIQRGYATGHGDTTEDLLIELDCQIDERIAAERKVIMDSLQKQADLATDALDRRWALEMIAAVAARSNT